MIKIVDNRKCCGCTACASICPVNCIEMVEDEEGFLYPKADEEKCIGCGACDRVCPVLNYKKRITFDETACLVQNKDEKVLKESTSGGAFTEIAKYVIKRGGLVYGVEMSDALVVRHTAVDNEADLNKFRNSKYVQSYLGDTFKDVKDQLGSGRFVCFSGTPCQAEGLLQFLGKRPENLILVDISCRAVPSPGVWKRYADYMRESHGEIQSVRFRDKGLGYQYSTMYIKTRDGDEREGIESAPWLRMFFSGMITRPSCSECKFRSPYRKTDLTIWDCYPTYRMAPEFDENLGTTRILVHTEKGREVFHEIRDSFRIHSISFEDVTEGVYEMQLFHTGNPRRKEFFEDYQSMRMGEVIEKYFPETGKVKAKKTIRRDMNKYGIDKTLKHILRKE